MRISEKRVACIVLVILFCLAAGCTDFLKAQPPAPNPSQSGGSSGSGETGSGSGNYPMSTYFNIDCKGKWINGGVAPKKQHGSFTLNGNVQFPIKYDPYSPDLAMYKGSQYFTDGGQDQ